MRRVDTARVRRFVDAPTTGLCPVERVNWSKVSRGPSPTGFCKLGSDPEPCNVSSEIVL